MKVLLLGAGYGTRLARDLAANGEYPALVGVAKPLLPIGGKPLVSYWMDILLACPETGEEVYVVVNASNYDQFKHWAADFPQVKLVNDGSTCNDNRLGAVACIELAVSTFNITDDLLVIAGDTLFYEDFKLPEFLAAFHHSPCKATGGALVASYNCKDEETRKLGIMEVDDSGKILEFVEKPSPDATQSRRACPCFYMFSGGALPLLKQFLEERQDAPLQQKDATGNFIKYLSSMRPVYTKEISGRFDVGGLQSYLDCCEHFRPQRLT